MVNGVEELSAEVAGQKISLKSVALNTILTILIFLGVAVTISLLWNHQEESKAASAAFVSAIKEQTTVQKEQTTVIRESNCIAALPPDRKHLDADFCKRVTR